MIRHRQKRGTDDSWPGGPGSAGAPLVPLVIETIEVVDGDPRPEIPQPSRKNRRQLPSLPRLIWVALGGVLLLTSTAIGIAAGSKPLSAHEALDRAAAFVAEATSYRYEGTITTRPGAAEAEGPGTTTIARTNATGAAVLPDRWRQFDDDGYTVTDRVWIGEQAYVRSAQSRELLAGELWAARDLTSSAAGPPAGVIEDDVVAFLATSMTILPVTALGEVVEYLRDAAIVDRLPGRVALRARVDVVRPVIPSDADVTVAERDAYYSSLPWRANIELEMTTAGVPVRLSMSALRAGEMVESEHRFTEWNEPVNIEAPETESVEPTPWIDEEELAKARQIVAAFAPTSPPAGMQLAAIAGRVDDLSGGDDGGRSCPQISIDYAELSERDGIPVFIFDDFGAYFHVILTSRTCADEYDDRAFAPGPFGDISVRDNGSYGGWELLFGDTVAQIITTLDDDELAPVLTAMAPFDIDAALPSASSVMAKTWDRYGMTFVSIGD